MARAASVISGRLGTPRILVMSTRRQGRAGRRSAPVSGARALPGTANRMSHGSLPSQQRGVTHCADWRQGRGPGYATTHAIGTLGRGDLAERRRRGRTPSGVTSWRGPRLRDPLRRRCVDERDADAAGLPRCRHAAPRSRRRGAAGADRHLGRLLDQGQLRLARLARPGASASCSRPSGSCTRARVSTQRPPSAPWEQVRDEAGLVAWERAWRGDDGPTGLFTPALLDDETVVSRESSPR